MFEKIRILVLWGELFIKNPKAALVVYIYCKRKREIIKKLRKITMQTASGEELDNLGKLYGVSRGNLSDAEMKDKIRVEERNV